MYASLIAASTLALASAVAAQGWQQKQRDQWRPQDQRTQDWYSPKQNVLRGGQCPYEGWQHCQDQGSWGCVQLAGPNCVDQTKQCDEACDYTGYAYQKDRSDDRTCVCSFEDASQYSSYWKTFKA